MLFRSTDTPAEYEFIKNFCEERGCEFALSEVWAKGGEGGLLLAEKVIKTLETKESHYAPLYPDEMGITEKIETIAKEIYGAGKVTYAPAAKKAIDKITAMGFGSYPVCMAKTQYSLSDDQTKLGRPEGFDLTVRDVYVSAGAGFVASALAHNKKTQELKLEQIKLKAFCEQILTSYLAQSKAKNLTLEVQIPDDFEINCDIKYLQHIISNLIQNAIRYNVVDGKLKITATSSANEWCLVVYNTGQTLANADKERIYERFYRADKARSAEGSGLGLAIVKEAVEALSGQIVVTSPYKNGTKFTVTLPLFLT